MCHCQIHPQNAISLDPPQLTCTQHHHVSHMSMPAASLLWHWWHLWSTRKYQVYGLGHVWPVGQMAKCSPLYSKTHKRLKYLNTFQLTRQNSVHIFGSIYIYISPLTKWLTQLSNKKRVTIFHWSKTKLCFKTNP